MFKLQLNLLPSPLNDLFTVNNTEHNHVSRQHTDLHGNTGLRDNIYIYIYIYIYIIQLSWYTHLEPYFKTNSH